MGARILKQDKVSKAATSELVAKARGGDQKSRMKLVTIYSYLPAHFALKLGVSVEQLPEVIKIGTEALHIAIERYQPNDPEHFTVYVRRWIERRVHASIKRRPMAKNVKKKQVSQYQQRVKAQLEVILALGDQVEERLTAQQYAVIRYRFGIAGRTRKTLDEIGAILRLSRARIHRIEIGAIATLEAFKIR